MRWQGIDRHALVVTPDPGFVFEGVEVNCGPDSDCGGSPVVGGEVLIYPDNIANGAVLYDAQIPVDDHNLTIGDGMNASIRTLESPDFGIPVRPEIIERVIDFTIQSPIQ